MGAALEFLRPSGAATWSVCSGYVAMRAAYPESPDEADNEVREDGTAAHWLASEIWNRRYPALESISPNHRVLTEEMFDGVDMYLDVLRSWQNVEVYVERTIPCDIIYPGMVGTPDAFAYDAGRRILYIADFKFGYRFVEVWWNLQLICYIAALRELLQLDDLNVTVVAVIVQPRSNHRDGPVRTWRVRMCDLRAEINILSGKAHDAMSANPPCTPNPGCTDCPARFSCVALQQSALRAVEMSYDGVPLELEPAAVGTELRLLKEASKRLEARITGLEAQAEALIRQGKVVSHFVLAPTYARERWREGTESQVLTLGHFYNVDLAKPRQPITPAQARKLLPSSLVAAFAHKPSTGVRLTPQDPYEAQKKFQPQPE